MNNEFKTPEWVQHANFYQIFPDRFAKSESLVKPNHLESWDTPPTIYGYKGGDLVGVVERLDYLKDLGIDAIYFTPIFQSASNHRYHTHDYLKVDPMLGGDAALELLLKEAHRHDIKIVLDGVFNHASRGFFQFNDILENGKASAYLDWFDIKGFPLHAYEGKPNYRCWMDLPALPEFNYANPQVRDYIYNVARYWIDKGIDGWRLDVPFCVDDDAFWQGFREVVKQANPEAYITGEIATDATRWLQGDQFDGVMNYLLTYALWTFVGGEVLDVPLAGHWLSEGRGFISPDVETFSKNVELLLQKYPQPAVQAQLNLLDSHDTARALSLFRGKKELLCLAVLFLYTYPGAPCIFYGDEIGLSGGQDPDCRQPFPWDSSKWDLNLFAFYQRLIAIRKVSPALRTGLYHTLFAQDGVLVFLRQLAGESVIVVLNRSDRTIHLDVDVKGWIEDGVKLGAKLTLGEVQVQNGRLSGASVAPVSGAIFG